MSPHCSLGLDIGSTTVKAVVLDSTGDVLFRQYTRHFSDVRATAIALLEEISAKLGESSVVLCVTGSGGIALAEELGVSFLQEVLASHLAISHFIPDADVVIELGGEDAKNIYFENGNVEQRMNGICAGGTGSFIDQMADLLQTDMLFS